MTVAAAGASGVQPGATGLRCCQAVAGDGMTELCLRDRVAWEQQGAGARLWVAATRPPGGSGSVAGVWRRVWRLTAGRPRSFLPPLVPPTTGQARQPGHQGSASGTSGTWRGSRSTDRMSGRRRSYSRSLRPLDRNVLGRGPLCPPTEPQVKARPTRIAGGWKGRPHPPMCDTQVPTHLSQPPEVSGAHPGVPSSGVPCAQGCVLGVPGAQSPSDLPEISTAEQITPLETIHEPR